MYRYLEWNEGRGDNGKKYTSTEGKTGQIYLDTQTGPHECSSDPVYYN